LNAGMYFYSVSMDQKSIQTGKLLKTD